MDFGIPKEVRDLETRVGLTPAGVVSLVAAGHRVFVQRGAGADAGFRDEHYEQTGARVVYSADEAYGRAEVILKVARPTVDEYRMLQNGQTLMAFLHLPVASPDLVNALIDREITAVAYEVMEEPDGTMPVLLPMSEVAGRLAPIYAGQLLTNLHGGRGMLLAGLPGVARGIVLVLGAGALGQSAARAFVSAGAQVIVLDNDLRRLRRVDELFRGKVSTMMANEFNLNRIVGFADVLVGAVLRKGQRAPILITREMVQKMRPGSVIMDFSIDQGGCVETSRPMTLRDPSFVAENVIHFCVPNLTAAVSRTSSHALTNALSPYLAILADCGLECALRDAPALRNGLKLYRGQIVSERLASALGRQVEIDMDSIWEGLPS
jgi:alanine dehydrogenase